jgi:hypothetical protein
VEPGIKMGAYGAGKQKADCLIDLDSITDVIHGVPVEVTDHKSLHCVCSGVGIPDGSRSLCFKDSL